MSGTNYDVYVRIIDLVEQIKASTLIQDQIQKNYIDNRTLALVFQVVLCNSSF